MLGCSSIKHPPCYRGEFQLDTNSNIGISMDFNAHPPIILTRGLFLHTDQWVQAEGENWRWHDRQVSFSSPWGVPGKALRLNWQIKFFDNPELLYKKHPDKLKIQIRCLSSIEPQIKPQVIELQRQQ